MMTPTLWTIVSCSPVWIRSSGMPSRIMTYILSYAAVQLSTSSVEYHKVCSPCTRTAGSGELAGGTMGVDNDNVALRSFARWLVLCCPLFDPLGSVMRGGRLTLCRKVSYVKK
ncbi:hypothetical protein JAAARDRAFT_604316 [Jaapia argillacea MUCL 33604]|uniref:Uncharacterized protein n=1 Tax=Jaapia argillacea MUCL 33604 TaxID=933084 RepID=A0A067QA19_9AGAM|nr:hypothetical protein JAAARDRAFT_604316 [Jaapia argillacea MUCL 33604]